GHTLAQHVGKSDQQLLERLNRDKRLREESSFADLDTAESAVATALQRNRAGIESWAAHAKPRQRHAWHYRSDTALGHGAYRPAGRSHIAERSSVTTVMIKNADGSCTLFTAYPSRGRRSPCCRDWLCPCSLLAWRSRCRPPCRRRPSSRNGGA